MTLPREGGSLSPACGSGLTRTHRPEIAVRRPPSSRACLQGKHLLPIFKLRAGGAAGLLQIYDQNSI